MPNLSYRSRPLVRRENPAPAPLEGSPKVIEGYFVVFDQPYYIDPWCEEYIDRHAFDSADMSDVRALINHNSDLVLGRCNANVQTMTFEIDDVGIYATIQVNEDDTDAVSLWARTVRGDVDQASFGFFEDSVEYTDLPDGRMRRTVRSIAQLWELSVCTFPAYEQTSVSARDTENKAKIKKEILNLRKSKIKRRLHYGKK